MSKLKLTDVEWGTFIIGDLFNVIRGNAKNISMKDKNGTIPLISAKDKNNGLNDFYNPDLNENIFEEVLTVNNNGSVAFSYFHDYKFIATSDVTVLKEKDKISKNAKKFLISVLNGLKNKYSYGYKMSNDRLKKQLILLPVSKQGNPNWQFMEDYIKQEQKEQAQKIINYYEQQMLKTAFDLMRLDDVEWKTFKFTELFREIKRGKRLKKADHIAGKVPYVSSTALNNGVDAFIGNTDGVMKFNDNLSLANSGSVGSCFYHFYEYVASDHVTGLSLKKPDKNIYLFMSTVIQRISEKYSFSREINDQRIKKEKIMLPADSKGNPHWEYMSKFIQNIEAEKLEKALEYIYIYIS